MSPHTEERALLWTHALQHIGLFLAGVSLLCIMLWLVFSKQDSKLYEADNIVCASQPFSLVCFERKPR